MELLSANKRWKQVDNSTYCTSCGNKRQYYVMQYEDMPNGSQREKGWKTFECKKCKLMLQGLHLIKVIQTRVDLVSNPDVKLELERLLECVPEIQLVKNE